MGRIGDLDIFDGLIINQVKVLNNYITNHH